MRSSFTRSRQATEYNVSCPVTPAIARQVRVCAAASIVLLAAALYAFAPPADAGSGTQTRVNKDAATIADFMKRVHDYVALHKKLDGTLREVPDNGTPEQHFEHQRALAALLRKERSAAKPGDICPKEMRAWVRRQLAGIFRGPAGRQIKRSILDEYTGSVRLEVNGGYPDDVPVSTMPPQLLQALPVLPEVLQYRFIGERLILLDAHAHIIADFVEHIFP
jgi:hypothetical protein